MTSYFEGFINEVLSLPYTVQAYPLIIQIAYLSIYIFLFISVLFLLSLFLIRKNNITKENIGRDSEPKIKKLIQEVLFGEHLYSEEEIQAEMKKIFNSKGFLNIGRSYIENCNLTVAISILRDINNNSQVSNEKYRLILKALKIEEFLTARLGSSLPGVKKKAINSFSDLNMIGLDSTILSYAYSNNKEVRGEARLSYLNLSKNDPYRFFDEFHGQMTSWTEIKLLNTLVEQLESDGILPNFGKWINYATNHSLIIFLIKVTAHFNQQSSLDMIRTKIDESDPLLRAEAILALSIMEDHTIEEKLIQMYYNQPIICQSAIIKYVGMLKSGKSISFLEKAFVDATSLELKKEIAFVLLHYNKEGKMAFDKMKANSELIDSDLNHNNIYNNLLFKHVQNNLILFK